MTDRPPRGFDPTEQRDTGQSSRSSGMSRLERHRKDAEWLAQLHQGSEQIDKVRLGREITNLLDPYLSQTNDESMLKDRVDLFHAAADAADILRRRREGIGELITILSITRQDVNTVIKVNMSKKEETEILKDLRDLIPHTSQFGKNPNPIGFVAAWDNVAKNADETMRKLMNHIIQNTKDAVASGERKLRS